MGEEYGEKAPFQYFVSHGDSGVIEAVRKGRAEEFASFEWSGQLPDPQDESTFLQSKLRWEARNQGEGRALLGFYGELLRLRREIPALAQLDQDSQEVSTLADGNLLCVRRRAEQRRIVALFYFGDVSCQLELPLPAGRWGMLLDSGEQRWNGPGGEAPRELASSGSAQLVLKPWSVLVWGSW